MSKVSVLSSYTVKESTRAKHVRLRLSLREGLVVIVPRGFAKERIAELLEKKRPWIERTSRRIEAFPRLSESEPEQRLPETIDLIGIGEQWQIAYRKTESARVIATECEEHRLTICGNTDNKVLCKAALCRWLIRKTHTHLVPWLQRLSDEMGTAFQRVMVKSQQTRWASCSCKKTISLNLKLLFIPESLIRHVLLHELCHLVHLNHSPRFWSLVRQHDPDFGVKNKMLRKAWAYIPAWLDRQ